MGDVIPLRDHLASAADSSVSPEISAEVLSNLETLIEISEAKIPRLADDARRLHSMVYTGDWIQGSTPEHTEELLKEKGFAFPANLATEIHSVVGNSASFFTSIESVSVPAQPKASPSEPHPLFKLL